MYRRQQKTKQKNKTYTIFNTHKYTFFEIWVTDLISLCVFAVFFSFNFVLLSRSLSLSFVFEKSYSSVICYRNNAHKHTRGHTNTKELVLYIYVCAMFIYQYSFSSHLMMFFQLKFQCSHTLRERVYYFNYFLCFT